MVLVWGSVCLPPHQATAHQAAADGETAIVGESNITAIGFRAQHNEARISEEEFQRLLSAVQGHDAARHRATIIHGRLGDKRAIEPMRAQLSRGHVVTEAHHALEQLDADKETLLQANIVAAKQLRQAAVASLGELGDKRAIACIMEVFHKEGAFFTAPSEGKALTRYLQEANTTLHKLDAAFEEQLQINLHVIQWRDPSDAVVLSAIEFIGHLADKRAIHPLIEAWQQRNDRHLADIQRVVEKLSIKERNDRDYALLVEQVIDQILDEVNNALEHLGIERESILQLNRDAVQKGSTKALATLMKYADKDSIPLLLTLLKKGDNKVRNYNEALEKLGAEKELIFEANIQALAGWNVKATLEILGQWGDRRSIGPIRRLLDMAEPVHTEAKVVLEKLGASWYDRRSDAERFGLWLGVFITCRALWRGCKMLGPPLRQYMLPHRG